MGHLRTVHQEKGYSEPVPSLSLFSFFSAVVTSLSSSFILPLVSSRFGLSRRVTRANVEDTAYPRVRIS